MHRPAKLLNRLTELALHEEGTTEDALRGRIRRIELLRDALAQEPEELTLVMGDLNVFGPERRRLMKIGAPIGLKRVRTFPAPRPIMALDRLWSIPFERLETLEAFSTDGARWASDHLPLVAMIRPRA